MTLPEFAEQLARKAHEGQLRKSGEPYISHPLMVRKEALNIYGTIFCSNLYHEDVEVVSLLHDVSEDTPITEDEILTKLIEYDSNLYYGNIYEALRVLNKNNHKDYLNYIIACKNNQIARVVKMADITHNLSDLKPGSLRDKYLLAKYILQS